MYSESPMHRPLSSRRFPSQTPPRGAFSTRQVNLIEHRAGSCATPAPGKWVRAVCSARSSRVLAGRVLSSTKMQSLKAHVHNGRLVLDEPTDLPEGEEVELVRLDEVLARGGIELDGEERE